MFQDFHQPFRYIQFTMIKWNFVQCGKKVFIMRQSLFNMEKVHEKIIVQYETIFVQFGAIFVQFGAIFVQ